MRTLLLMRHAKSSWDTPDQDDFDRPLTKRGTKAAPIVAAHLAENGLIPDLIISSSSVRTRATLALALPEFGRPAPRIVYDDALYLASPRTIESRLAAEANNEKTIMILGHNPGLHALALSLSGEVNRKTMRALAMKFPTAAVAVIALDSTSWTPLNSASGTLQAFIQPRELA